MIKFPKFENCPVIISKVIIVYVVHDENYLLNNKESIPEIFIFDGDNC